MGTRAVGTTPFVACNPCDGSPETARGEAGGSLANYGMIGPASMNGHCVAWDAYVMALYQN
jgi:hypothetical protein